MSPDVLPALAFGCAMALFAVLALEYFALAWRVLAALGRVAVFTFCVVTIVSVCAVACMISLVLLVAYGFFLCITYNPKRP